MRPSAAIIGLLAFLSSATADAEAERYGARGTIQPGGTADFQWVASAPLEGDSTSELQLNLRPSLLLFMIDDFALGGSILVGWVRPEEGDPRLSYGIAPQVAYNVVLGQTTTLLPSLSIVYSSHDLGLSENLDRLSLEAFTPILFHFDQFFIGLGPDFAFDLSAKFGDEDQNKETRAGIRAMVGGWL